MAYKEKEIEKLYYSIGEVAEIFTVAPSLIRFWESEFDIIKPKKNRKGNRQFTKEDIDNVRTIYHLVKEKGFTLQGAKEMLRNDSQAVKDKMEMLDSLRSVRNFLVELREKTIVKIIRELSKKDFPESEIQIDDNGLITYLGQ